MKKLSEKGNNKKKDQKKDKKSKGDKKKVADSKTKKNATTEDLLVYTPRLITIWTAYKHNTQD